MKKYIKLTMTALAITITAVYLSACSASKTPDTDTSPSQAAESPAESPAPDPAMLAKEPEGEKQITENNIPDSGHVFELTADERAISDAFKENMDMEIFREVDPVSIAKIHLMYGVEGEWKAEYAMFYKEDGMRLSEEDYEAMYLADLEYEIEETKRSLANWYFPLIEDSEFEVNGNEGVLKFHSVAENEEVTPDETEVNFAMIKDKSGLWWVKENPVY